MTTTSKTDPRIERTRQLVLDAAAELLGECGFGRTTIESVAERSGVARSTIYRHWPQRPDLLVDAIERHVGEMPEPDTGQLRTDLITIFTALGGWLSDPQLGSMGASLMVEAKRDERLAGLHERFTQRRRGKVEDVIRRGLERGDIPKNVDVAQMAHDLAAPMFYRALVTHEPLDDTFIPAHVDRWLAIHSS